MKGDTAVVETSRNGGDVSFISGSGKGVGGNIVFCVGKFLPGEYREVFRFTWDGQLIVAPEFTVTEAAQHFWSIVHEIRASLGTSGLKVSHVPAGAQEPVSSETELGPVRLDSSPAEDLNANAAAEADHRDYVLEQEREEGDGRDGSRDAL